MSSGFISNLKFLFDFFKLLMNFNHVKIKKNINK